MPPTRARYSSGAGLSSEPSGARYSSKSPVRYQRARITDTILPSNHQNIQITQLPNLTTTHRVSQSALKINHGPLNPTRQHLALHLRDRSLARPRARDEGTRPPGRDARTPLDDALPHVSLPRGPRTGLWPGSSGWCGCGVWLAIAFSNAALYNLARGRMWNWFCISAHGLVLSW